MPSFLRPRMNSNTFTQTYTPIYIYIYKYMMHNALCEYKNAEGNCFLNTIHQNSSWYYWLLLLILHKTHNYWWRHLQLTSDPTAVTKCQSHWGIYTEKPFQLTTSTARPLPYIDRYIWVPNNHPYNTIVTIF